MLNVRIKNFQSIGDVSFDIDGFTVIVGKNNLGKSAIVRAVDAALTNRTGSEFIRWGKTKSEVILKKDDLEIDWSKGETAVYKVNGKSFSKLNRTIPQPIIDAGIRKIEIGDQKLNPLIAHQFEELFLIDKPGSVITDVLSVIYNLHVLSDADDLCLKALKGQRALLKTRESDLSILKEQVDKYADLESIKNEMEALRVLDKKVEDLKKEIAFISYYSEQVRILSDNIAVLKKASEVKIPSAKKVEDGIAEFQWVAQAAVTLRTLLVTVKGLAAASKTELPGHGDLQALIDQLGELNKLSSEFTRSSQAVKKLKSILDTLDGMEKHFGMISSIDAGINELRQIKTTNEEFLASAKTVKDLKAEIDTVTSDLDSAQKEYAQYDVCPLCSKPL